MPSIDRQEQEPINHSPCASSLRASSSSLSLFLYTHVCSRPCSLPSRHKKRSRFSQQDSAAAAAFPRVERDLLQVEAYASALRQRLARADGGRGDAAAAARLLAHEGVNTRK